MNIATLQFYSPVLNRHVTYSAILPQKGTGPWPVLMQLHGLSDNHASWLTYSNIARYVEKYPLMVILPDGDTSWYTNVDRFRCFEELLVGDLTNHVRATFRVKEGPWAIGGLSMGGYGAMRLGMKYRDRFASIWSHSGALKTAGELREEGRLPNPGPDEDILLVAERFAAQPGPRPVISFDCGTEDQLLGENRRFHAHLDQLGIPHNYQEHTGSHTWDYWDEHVREALAQHAAILC